MRIFFTDLSKIIKGGQNNARIISNVLIETDRTGTIYWQWRAFDDIKITEVTPDNDLTQNTIDFTHINSFAEDTDGNLIVSFRNLDEIIKINKSNRQIIWRMGGTMCKNNQFTFINDSDNGFTGFSHQHSISLLPNGNILMFDNGNLKNPPHSRAVEYQIDEINKTATNVWEYRYNPAIFTNDMGSAFRLVNNNTIINWGSYKITEVRQDKSIAFEMNLYPGNSIYRAYRLVTRMNAVSKYINIAGDYNFNDSNFTTGVTLSVSSIAGTGLTSIEKHNYSPPSGDYKDSDLPIYILIDGF